MLSHSSQLHVGISINGGVDFSELYNEYLLDGELFAEFEDNPVELA